MQFDIFCVTARVRSSIGIDARWDFPIGRFAFMAKYLDDILLLLGAVLITIGTWRLYPVATWFVAGGFCIVFGILYSLGGRMPSAPTSQRGKK